MSTANSTIPSGFRQIPGFPRYCIAEDGTILSSCSPNGRGAAMPWNKARRVVPVVGSNGYHRVSLCNGGRVQQVQIHALMLETYVGPRPDGYECRHLDGTRGNNHIANLAWGTHAENMQDKVFHGTLLRGERHGSAKLTAADVSDIRRRASNGERHRILAEEFHILRSSVGNIVRRLSWKHI